MNPYFWLSDLLLVAIGATLGYLLLELPRDKSEINAGAQPLRSRRIVKLPSAGAFKKGAKPQPGHLWRPGSR